MKVFKYEILDGLAASVQSQASIAFCSPAVLSTTDNCKLSHDVVQKIKASTANPKQLDLYYIKSVLVSTGWNKNDDVFSTAATWAARSTPEDKQFNFMHNENDIIGHITGSYVIDRNGNAVANDTTDIPSEFDIITEAVLYNSWTNPENRERMNKIIAEIEQGKWFVSMECLFAGFDYALISPDGGHKVIARNDDSSFLTKHLRAYGGTGQYEDYKIGRSLRDISFSGKGLVSKPANPRSVILDASKAFSINEQSSSNLNQGEKDMSDTNTVEQQVEAVAVATEQVSSETQATENVEVNVTELQQSLSNFEQTNKTLTEAVAEKDQTIQNLQDALAAKEAELNDVKAEMHMMKKKEKMAMRKASLIQAGFEDAEAEQSLALYDNLEDSAFEAIVAVYKKKMAKMEQKVEVKENVKKDEENESKNPKASIVAEEVTEELFDGVKSTEATLVDASGDEDELNATRASVAQWLTDNVFSK